MPAISYSGAKILVVDNEPGMVRFMARVLARAGYTDVRELTDATAALAEVERVAPDLVVLDLYMPGLDGFAFLQRLRERVGRNELLPVLVVTADTSPDVRRRAHDLGARDYVLKPFEGRDFLARVHALLDARAALDRLQQMPPVGESRAAQRGVRTTAEVQVLKRLIETCQYRDRVGEDHTRGVGLLATEIAVELGLSLRLRQALAVCAPLHDLGKIAIPQDILLKPGPLTAGEMAIAQRHTTIGAMMLSGTRFPLLRLAATIALTHHERWDGTGYPRRLARERIPQVGRIVAVADVFDALTHDRPYKGAWPVSQALAEIVRQRDRQFDPVVVDALLRVVERLGADRLAA